MPGLDIVHLTLASLRSTKMTSISFWKHCAREGRSLLNVSQGFTLYHMHSRLLGHILDISVFTFSVQPLTSIGIFKSM
jgi:hypothetical protein